MSSTKDTPMDYRQFEGHKRRCQYELWVEEYFGLPADFPVEGTSKDFDYGQMVNMLAMFDVKREREIVALKLELQKQKELNAELVNWIKEIPYQWAISELYWGSPAHEKAESLIKKSNEI